MAALANGNPVTDSNSNSSLLQTTGKQQSKTTMANAKSEGPRKQNNVGNDVNQRRVPPQKAWMSGMNPITQRSTTPSQQNGIPPLAKPTSKATSHEGGSEHGQCNEQLSSLLAHAMGTNVAVTTASGDVYTGIFFGASMNSNEPEYLLKMVQRIKSRYKGDANGVRDPPREYVGFGEDHTMTFKQKEVLDLRLDNITVDLQDKRPNGVVTSAFRSDFEISGHKAGQQRELQPWVPPVEDGNGQALECSVPPSGWDQFKTNEILFGVTSDYSEDIYTSRIDKSHPNYRQREAAAQRLAQKMGDSSVGEINEAGNFNEEEKYSSVRREAMDYPPLQSTQPNRYQPPARRPPSGKPTVAGAPVDPAIISSQIARTDANSKPDKDGKEEGGMKNAVNESSRSHAAEQSSEENSRSNETQEFSNTASPSTSKQPGPQEATATGVAKAPAATAYSTTNVEVDALKAFKQFSEKQKIRVADDRRQRVMQDKNVKLNDLRGFSKNFKLNTPVPSDLVPILAKDKKKQDEIMEKAQRNAEEQSASPIKSPPKPGDQAASKSAVESKRDVSKSGQGLSERSDFPRRGVPPRGPQTNLPLRDRQGPAQYQIPNIQPNEQGLSHRLAKTQRDRQQGVTPNLPAPLPIHTGKPQSRPSTNAPRVISSQASSAMRTPTSATSGKFNVRANEFVPNPAANTFLPTNQTSAASSPKASGKGRSISQGSSAADFFGKKKPLPKADRPSILENFHPLNRLKEKASKEGKAKDYAANGGIAYAYATSVTWTAVVNGEEGKSYKEIIEGPLASSGPSPRPSTVSPINPNLPHQHQLPAHLQQGPHGTPTMQTPPQAMYPVPTQQHLYPGMPQHFDEQRIHGSPSVSAYSTPRMQNAYGHFAAPMAQPVQGPIPGAFQYPPAMGPGHPQMMNPGGPQSQFRSFSNGPQYISSPGQQLAAPMMVQQGSQGPYMAQGGPVSHVPVYAAGGMPSYGASQPASGYPSPGRGAPMMMHQGSFQGQNGQMHAPGQPFGQPIYSPQPPPNMAQMRGYPSPQPQYSQSPQQHYQYAPQPHRVPSHGYSHHPQGPPPVHMQQHQPPLPPDAGEGNK